jgi:hypothetical protein
MPTFGRASKAALATIDKELQDVLKEAIKHIDFSIVWGHPIRWGGHWKNYTGRGFYDRDWAHFEKIT